MQWWQQQYFFSDHNASEDLTLMTNTWFLTCSDVIGSDLANVVECAKASAEPRYYIASSNISLNILKIKTIWMTTMLKIEHYYYIF